MRRLQERKDREGIEKGKGEEEGGYGKMKDRRRGMSERE